MASLDERIAQLSPAKRRLLEMRLQELGATIQTNQGIPRRTADGPVPLSYGQQRFWFVHELEPETPLYNNLSAARIRGPLDVQALQRALTALVARHEILRTLYVQDLDGQPLQSVCSERQFAMPVIDLRQAPDSEQTLRQLLAEQARRRFDLTKEISLRACLYVLGEQDYVFCEVHHHIATDFWSSGIMRRELYTLYDAFRKGQDPALPDLPIQYADFAVWQRQQEKSEAFTRQLDYWRRKLGGTLPSLNLPARTARAAAQSHRGASAGVHLDAELVSRLQELGRGEGATLFMTLTAAFLALFQRYTHQDDLVVGVLNAGRTRVEMESLIGAFINVLVFRTDVSGNPTFRELLGRTRKVAIDAYANQDVPFERLVAELHPDRSPNADPIVQVMFDFLNAPGSKYALPDVDWNPLTVDNSTAEHEMLIAARPKAGGLDLSVHFLTDLYDAGAITRLLDHLTIMLEAVVTQPEQRLADVPILTADERQQILVTWNNTASVPPPFACFPDFFEARAALAPDAIAVETADGGMADSEVLTYAELSAAANQIAGYLRSLGVGPETIVGVCLELSPLLIEAFLGVLKAGGVFMPLDPGLPDERLRFFIEDSGTPIVLTQNSLKSRLPVARARLVSLDVENEWRHCGTGPLASGLVPQNAAYLIYTSGSTGQPKGVVVEHRSLVSYLAWRDPFDLFRPGERVLFLDAIGFDAMVGAILGPLTSQGTLVLPPADARTDPNLLLDTVIRRRITRFDPVPSLLRALANRPQFAACSTLRLIVTGAETVPVDLKEQIMALLPVRVVNGYGPTEATIAVLFHDCVAGAWEPRIPIGFPTANTQIYILNPSLRPVPIGVTGEIYIGGIQVARGYLASPATTAAKFIPNPFGPPGERMYETGDLGRWLPNGEVDFLGRNDHQVKVRGHRIELGEIEAALLAHPGIDEAVLQAPDDGAGSRRLIAYVKPRLGQNLTSSDLVPYLRAKLPSYMIPSGFVFLDTVPKSATGKIDRKALPSLDVIRSTAFQSDPHERLGRKPSIITEARMAAIWGEVLGVDHVGVDDDFFDLGGHSLLAAQLIYRLRAEFHAEVPLRALFEHSTIAGLARYFDTRTLKAQSTEGRRHLLFLQPQGSRPPLYLLPGGGGGESEYLHVYANLIHQLGSDQPVYGFQAQTADGAEFPFDTVEQMASSYVSELRSVQPHGPYILAGECIGAKVALEMARQLADDGDNVAELVFLNAVVTGTASQASASRRVQHAIRNRVRQLRTLPAAERLPRLKTMASNAAVAILPVSDRQRRQQAQRSARLGYMALLSSYTPPPYDGNVTLLMTGDLAARGRAEAWHDFVRGRLTVAPLVGVHRTYLGVHVATNAATMKTYLDSAQEYLGVLRSAS